MRIPSEKRPSYPYEFREIYVEGEEDEAWDKVVKDKFHQTDNKRIYVVKKTLTKIKDIGLSQVDRGGNILKKDNHTLQ